MQVISSATLPTSRQAAKLVIFCCVSTCSVPVVLSMFGYSTTSLITNLQAALILIPICAIVMVPLLFVADEVQDVGDALIVRRAGHEARIPLADIVSLTRPGSFVLTLRMPCRFGSKIRFRPIMKKQKRLTIKLPEPDPAIYDDLIKRINEAQPRALQPNAATR